MAKPIGKRISTTVSPEIASRLDELKRERFYNRPYSAMYLDLLLRGLKSHEASIKREQRETSEEE